MLFVTALAAHAVLIAWAKITFGLRAAGTMVLGAIALVLSLALFLPRENFGKTSFELAVVALGGVLFAGLVGVARLIGWFLARRRLLRATARRVSPAQAPVEDAGAPDPRGEDSSPEPGRRQLLAGVAGAASWTLAGGALTWGSKIGRHDFELVETPIVVRGLPRVLDGYAIVQISDLHLGEFVGERDLDEGLRLAARARPDLLVVTGDFVDFDPSYTRLAASRIARVPTRDGVVGVLGNHDYYADAATIRDVLAQSGIQLLVDDARVLRERDGGGFTLVGLDELSAPRYGGRGPNVEATLAFAGSLGRDRPRILLAHQPRLFDQTAGNVALQLSGHTHGLQFDFAARLGRMAHRYVSGRYERDGSTLWVNRGFGVTGPPSRIGVRPEITKIVLISG